MMGSIDAWFYKYIVGIQLDETNPAFSEFTVHPALLEGLNHAEAKIETLKGTVASKWQINEGMLNLEIEVPFNTSATVVIPGKETDKILENNQEITDSDEIKYLGYFNGEHRIRANSGNYRFTLKN